MYKIAGVGLIGLFIFMVLPSNAGLTDTNTLDAIHYGAVSMVIHDVNGNERFSQTIHNVLTDQGETFILEQVFEEGNTPTTTETIGTICITDPTTGLSTLDTETAVLFDADNTISEVNCKQIGFSGGVTTSNGVATIGPLTFNSTGNIPDGGVLEGIAICQTLATNNNDFTDCATGGGGSGILFSVINTSNVTLASGEDVDITYTFDISADG